MLQLAKFPWTASQPYYYSDCSIMESNGLAQRNVKSWFGLNPRQKCHWHFVSAPSSITGSPAKLPYMEWRFSQYSSLLGEIKYSIILQFLLSPHQAVRWSIFSKLRNFIFFSSHRLSPQLDIAKCNTSAKHVELQFQGDLESKGLETWLNILQCIRCRPFKQLMCVCEILCVCIGSNMCEHWMQHFKLASLTSSSPFPTCRFSQKHEKHNVCIHTVGFIAIKRQ